MCRAVPSLSPAPAYVTCHTPTSSASEDATIRAWALDTGCCLQIYQGHLSAVRSMRILSYVDVLEGQAHLRACANHKGGGSGKHGPHRAAPAPVGGVLCTAACDLRVWDIDSGDVLEVMARRRCDVLATQGPLLIAALQGAMRSFSFSELPSHPPPSLTRPSPVVRPVISFKHEPAAKGSIRVVGGAGLRDARAL